MRKIALLFALLAIIGCKTVPKRDLHGVVFASATLEQKSGSNIHGRISFRSTKDGIVVHAVIDNAEPGLHGIHIHEKGDCSAPDAMSAGAHFNPTSLIHGTPDPRKYHVGDLGNINVDQNGHGDLDLLIPVAHFNEYFKDYDQIIGKSVIVHSKADDLVSQPAGDSGSRIACGVIVAD